MSSLSDNVKPPGTALPNSFPPIATVRAAVRRCLERERSFRLLLYVNSEPAPVIATYSRTDVGEHWMLRSEKLLPDSLADGLKASLSECVVGNLVEP